MRAANALKTARDVDRVGRSVRNVGRDSKKTSWAVRLFTRAITIMQTRAVMAVLTTGLLGAAIVALAPALALATGGVVAMVGSLVPLGLLAVAAASRFAEMKDVAGSASNELLKMGERFKAVFDQATAPAADTTFRALAKAMRTLQPLIESLRGPMLTFSRHASVAIGTIATGLADLGPEFRKLIAVAGPVMRTLAEAVEPLGRAFLQMAIAGMPVLAAMAVRLADFGRWLSKATVWTEDFLRTSAYLSNVATAWGWVQSAGRYAWGVMKDLWGIATQLWTALTPIRNVVQGLATFGFRELARMIGWVNRNFATLQTVLTPLVAGIVAYRTAMLVAAAATWLMTAPMAALNAVMLLNPIALVVAGVVALGVALYIAYQKSETFRKGVQLLWNGIKAFAAGAAGAIRAAFTKVFDWLAGKINWLIDKINGVLALLNKLPGNDFGLVGAVGPGAAVAAPPGSSPPRAIGGFARGGVVRRSGMYEVGERGRERVHLPAGAAVEPHGGFEREVVVHSHLHVDGREMAQSVARAGTRKLATR